MFGRILDAVRKTLIPASADYSTMHTTRRAVLGTVAATTLTGCLAGGGEADSPPTTGTTTGDGGTTSAATVRVASHSDLGDILVDADGVTLYMFDSDTRGDAASTCYDSCAQSWPPLTVAESPTAGADVSASLETFERENGDRQVTANGWPLYYYASDAAPGDANGQGVGDVWWVLAPDGTPVESGATSEGGSGGGGGY